MAYTRHSFVVIETSLPDGTLDEYVRSRSRERRARREAEHDRRAIGRIHRAGPRASKPGGAQGGFSG